MENGADHRTPCQDCDCTEFRPRRFTDVLTHPDRLEAPLHWKKPRRVFVNSMSDLFHEDVPFEFVFKVFTVMAATEWHTFQILTKRPERMRDFMELTKRELSLLSEVWPLPNIWLGVSVEDQKTADARIPLLLQTPAAVRFVSYEPALDAVDFRYIVAHFGPFDALAKPSGPYADLAYPALDWIIVGGESGPKARPFNLQWARDVIAQCKVAGVPVFIKQMGTKAGIQYRGYGHKEGELTNVFFYDRAGGDPLEWPEDLRVREFPRG